jgi:Leucine-rich repeat (LRR) protein
MANIENYGNNGLKKIAPNNGEFVQFLNDQIQTINTAIDQKVNLHEINQPNGVVGLNENGEIEIPITIRSNVQPEVGELIINNGLLYLGDGTQSGQLVEIVAQTSLLTPPECALIMSVRGSGNIAFSVATSSGQYAVDWWDGTRTTHNSEVTASKACVDNRSKLIKIYPSVDGEELLTIDASDSDITNIDVTNCENLQILKVGLNDLKTINLKNNISLQEFHCHSNDLESVDFSGMGSLTYINCADNNLIAFNVNNCEHLEVIDCSFNLLTSYPTTSPS